MLRMINSARSRLALENGGACASTLDGGARGGAAARPRSEENCGPGRACDPPAKRAAFTRAVRASSSKPAPSRARPARSSSAGISSEIAAPEIAASQLAGGTKPASNVLGEITNVIGSNEGIGSKASVLKATPLPVSAPAPHAERPSISEPPSPGGLKPGKAVALPEIQGTGSTCASTPRTAEAEDVTPEEAANPQCVTEYMSDIYKRLHHEELSHLPEPDYMERQPHINARMRAILVDWLVDVHKKYKLRTETLFLAVAIIDRFLERRHTARQQLQLVGVTSMLIAAKFEEIYPPEIKDFIYITDRAYTREEVINMEVYMLQMLDFSFCSPTAAHFFERYQRVNQCDEAHRCLAHYILELALVDYKMIRYAPSHVAAAAVLLSNKLLRRSPQWPAACVRQTQLTDQMLRACMKEMCGVLETADGSSLQAVRKKFSQQKFHAVAKINFQDGPPGGRDALTKAAPSS